jgi:WbqC-like protein
VFVIYDDTQYKHDEWQNRNRIKSADGWQWLTVPVHHSQGELIRDIRIENTQHWTRKHANAVATNYARAPYYRHAVKAGDFAAVYTHEWEHLAELNISLIRLLCRLLGIDTPVVRSSELGYEGKATDALVSMCREVGADTYLSGPGGRNYLEPEKFGAAGLTLKFHDYEPVEYPQTFGDFVPGLSLIDLILNCGPGSADILRSARRISDA